MSTEKSIWLLLNYTSSFDVIPLNMHVAAA